MFASVPTSTSIPSRRSLSSRSSSMRRSSSSAVAQLRRYPREPEAVVDLLLGGAAERLTGRVVEDPVLGDVQPAPHGALAQADVVRLGAGEVLQHVAELVRGDDLEVHAHAGVGAHTRA